MERRRFLHTALTLPVIAAVPAALREAAAAAQADGWRTFETVTKVEIANPSGVSRAWVPLPYKTRTDWHNPLGSSWTGNGQMKVVTDGKYGAEMLYAEWKSGERTPVVEVTSRFATRDRAVDPSKPSPNAAKLSAAEVTTMAAGK